MTHKLDEKALAARITDYLANGGLFNPESMEHEKVRDLLIDCRDALAAAPSPAPVAVKGWKLVPVEFLDFIKNAPVSSGVCCCGDDLQIHADPMSCGHSPVDQWDYSLSQWMDEIGIRSALVDPVADEAGGQT